MLPPATADLYEATRRRVAAVLLLTHREWADLGSDFEAGWARIGPRLTTLVASAMVGAAEDGAAAVPAALAQTGFPVVADAAVTPAGFGRFASDGRPLRSLLYGSVVRARTAPGSIADQANAGRRFLDMAVRTQVGDAARGASQVAITARPRVGWVRMVNPPCCQDCAVLAGKWFRHNQGFKRHPHDDCVHRPAHEDENPRQYRQTVDPGDIHDLTVGQRAALAEGADLGRVVNAYRRGPAGASPRMTTTGELAGSGARRLTPDGILQVAGSRDEALNLLAQNGYLAA